MLNSGHPSGVLGPGQPVATSAAFHCHGNNPCEIVEVVRAGFEKYHSPWIKTLVALGSP
jgi:hypothetical protein